MSARVRTPAHARPGPDAVLAIELSQRAGSVALRPARGAPAVACDVPASDEHGDHLMDSVDRLCASAGLGARDLRTIAVSTGPGGFTGLRVACATARAIADATGAGIVAVPSALVAARTLVAERLWEPVDGALACVILAAKGHDAWSSTVRIESGMPRLLGSGLVQAGSELGHLAIGDRHARALWPAVEAARWLEARFCAKACLEVAEALDAAEGPCDPTGLLPIYPRPPEAVALWDRRHGVQSP